MSKPWQPYAQYILDCIEKIHRIMARGDILHDDILYDALLRNLQTLSEATQHLPDTKNQLCPAIPWQQIIGFRNILVHNYLGNIDPLTVHRVVTDELPALQNCIEQMLAGGELSGMLK